jgi:hypothetical protein
MTHCETEHHSPARLADLADYARLFDSWSGVRHRQVLRTCQLGYLRDQPVRRRRARPDVPLLHLLVDPARSADLADPRTGFGGLAGAPDPGRVLTVWADDLLSVRHHDDWMYVVDADRPFDAEWLRLLGSEHGPAGRSYAVVSAAVHGPAPAGEFSVVELDATTYTTLVRVEDLRGERPVRSRAGR